MAQLLHRVPSQNIHTLALQQSFQRRNDGTGTAHREMNPMSSLEVMNKRIDTGGVEGITSDQQRLNRKSLTKFVMLQKFAHHVPDRPIASQPGQGRKILDHQS